MLSGLRVVAVESYGVVPGATGLLADMGATVIRLEPPGVGDGLRNLQRTSATGGRPGGSLFDVVNRGKQSVTLDVSTPAGREVLFRLLADADVFAHNLRPTALERFELTYESLSEQFPRLVYASFTAYGDKGLDRDRPGLGPVALWSRAGLAANFGDLDTMPEPTRGAMDDTVAALGLFGATLGALLERATSGRGQQASTSHYHVGAWINTLLHERLAGNEVPLRLDHWSVPSRAFYQCADDKWVLVAGVNERQWHGLLRGLELDELISDERYESTEARRANREELVEILQRRFRTRTAREWADRIRTTGGVCDLASHLDDVISDPQAIENGFFFEQETDAGRHRLLAPPLHYSRTPLEPGLLAPELGEHTDMVLGELGYEPAEIEALRADGVV